MGFANGPNPSQSRLLGSGAIEKLAIGPPACGKSEGGYFDILAAACKYPGNICAIARRQLIDVKERTVPHFFRIARKELFTNWVPASQFINRSPCVLHLHNGSQISFMGFDTSESAGSANWGAIMLQEVFSPLGGKGIPQEVYDSAFKALRCPAAPYRFIIADTNQAPPDHWLHDKFGDTGRPGHEVIFFRWEENRDNLPEAFVRAMESEWGKDPVLRRLLEPGWQQVFAGKAVFGDVFQPGIHINESLEFDPDQPVWRSWDSSFTQPWVTWSQVVDRQWRVLGEYLPSQCFLPELIGGSQLYGAQHFPGANYRDCADHAVTQRHDTGVPIEIMRQHGISPVSTPTQSVRSGIEVMVDYLTRTLPHGRAAFQIHPRCQATIQCLQHGYRWKKGRDERLRDEPMKDGFFDNGADSLRYVVANVLGGIVRVNELPMMDEAMATYWERAPHRAPLLVGNRWLNQP